MVALSEPRSNSQAVPNSSTPESRYVDGDHIRRPTVSKSLPSSSGPEEVADRDDREVVAGVAGRHVEERGEDRAEAEGDRVVEERLADEEGEAEDRRACGYVAKTVRAISTKPVRLR